MAETNRKKTASFDEGAAIGKDKEKVVEKTAQSKRPVKSPKPPLPPRPPGLSRKQSSAKRSANLSKTLPEKAQPKDNASEGSTRPRRPPPPSHQASLKNTENEEGQGNDKKEVESTKNEEPELLPSDISTPAVQDSTSKDNSEHQKHTDQCPDVPKMETNSVTKASQDSIEISPSVNSSEKQSEIISDDVIQSTSLEGHTESKNTAAQPSGLENSKTSTDNSQLNLHSPSAAATTETLENSVNTKTSSKVNRPNPKTPERPKPPIISSPVTTDDKSNSPDSNSKDTPTLSETPTRASKAPKKSPAILPKPVRKGSLGKYAPPVQARTDEQSTKGKSTEATGASEMVKESDVEKSTTVHAETPSGEDNKIKSASSEVIVVPQTNDEVSSAPEDNEVFHREIKPSESCNENLPAVVSIPTEHPKANAVTTEAAANVSLQKTEERSVKSENVPKTEAKPPRPRAPSRKIEEDKSNGDKSSRKKEEGKICRDDPSRKLEEEMISEGGSVIPDSISVKPEPIDEKSFDVETNETLHEAKKIENVTSPKPPRPRAPSRKTTDEKSVEIQDGSVNTSSKASCSLDQGSFDAATQHGKTDKMASPKPSRPSRPVHTPSLSKPVKTVDNREEAKNNGSLKHKNTEKPQRPSQPRLPSESAGTPTDCSSIPPESHKFKPQRPSKPNLPGESTQSEEPALGFKTENSVTINNTNLQAGACNENAEIIIADETRQEDAKEETCSSKEQEISKDKQEHKHIVSSKPSRPARPNIETNVTDETRQEDGKEETCSSKEQEISKDKQEHKHIVSSKPSRPARPNIETNVTDETTQEDAKEETCFSKEQEILKDKQEHKHIISNKPSRPAKPNIETSVADETRQEDTKEDTCSSKEQDISKDKQEHKHIVSNKPSRPAKPNIEIAVKKEEKQAKEDTVESESIRSVKKTGSVKPSRPPKPVDTLNDISSSETSSPCKTEPNRPRPPRPQAPQRQASVVMDVETSAKPHEGDHEKDKQEEVVHKTKPSVEAPPKPKRTSISSDDYSNIELSRQENIDKAVEILKEQKEISNEAMSDERKEAASDHDESAFTGNCEETNKDLSETHCDTGEHSKPIVQPISPNEANPVSSQKVPFIIVKRRDKGVQEASENEKSLDRHNVKFRVSSLSKTEVESFNSKDFVEKMNDKGRTKRNSTEGSVATPPIRPKPSRPRPPSSDQNTGNGGERGAQTEGLGNKVKNKDGTEVTLAKNDKTGELEKVDKSEATGAAIEADKVCNTDKEGPVRELSGSRIIEVAASEKTNQKKVKRKAPPVPVEKKNEHVENPPEHVEKLTEHVEKHSGHVEKPSEHIEKHAGNVEKHSEDVGKHSGHVEKPSEDVEKKIENNNEPVKEASHEAMDVTIEHQVISIESAEPAETLMDKGVKNVSPVSESLQSCGKESDDITPDTEVKTQKVGQNICNEVTPSKQESKRDENPGVTEGTNAVHASPKKKKTPPQKPVRTSSLKRDSKPIVLKKETGEEDVTTETKRKSSPSELNEIIEETTGTSDPTDSVVQSPKAVKFSADTPELQRSSTSVARSKSFAGPRKDRSKKKDGENTSDQKQERLSRSFSFSGRKKNQPPRPSPPTFFVSEVEPEDSANPETVGEEQNKDDIVISESISSSQEDLVESEYSGAKIRESSGNSLKPCQDGSERDSYLTTDSESENEKEEEKSKTYYISREILTTERTFVDAVKLVSEDFRNAVANGNKKFGRAVIPDETLQDIVMNISQIYTFDSEFLKALENRMETWEKEERIGDIIKKFSPFLRMYSTYIKGYDNAMAILTDALKKHPQFAEVVSEFERSERCNNLRVGMYMLKPIQRIPSYRLLLMDYIKHLSKDSLDYKDVSDALAIVSEVATHINEDMKRAIDRLEHVNTAMQDGEREQLKDNFEEVLKIQRNLVGQVEIVKPGRELIKEGALMKLSRKEMQPKMFFLLTDVLLYTTPVANNQFRLNISLPLEEIEVELPVSPDFENEFSIISRKKSFILSASTADERDEWLEALRNASDEMRKKKSTFHLAKKEKMDELYDAQQQDEDNDAKLGSKAPVWIPDARVTMCMLCTDDFTVTNRRHHCRACGKVICGSCSSNSAPLAYLNYETARVCDICHDELTVKAGSTQAATETKENGVPADASPKMSGSANKKSRKSRLFFKSKEEWKLEGKKRVVASVVTRRRRKFRNRRQSDRSLMVPAVEESTISGYLKTQVGKKWQKRWYVVKDNVLYASKASSDPAAQETRPLLGYDVRGPEEMGGDSKKIVFQLIHAGTEPVVLQTDNMKHGEQWVNALRRATILPM